MQQEIKRSYVGATSDLIGLMSKNGYVVKQIAGTGDEDYIWILFEKPSNAETSL